MLSALALLSRAGTLCHVPVPFPARGSHSAAPTAAAWGGRAAAGRSFPLPPPPPSSRLTLFSGPMAPRYVIAAEFPHKPAEMADGPGIPKRGRGWPGWTPRAPAPCLDVPNLMLCLWENDAGRGSEISHEAAVGPHPRAVSWSATGACDTPRHATAPAGAGQQARGRGSWGAGAAGAVGALVALGRDWQPPTEPRGRHRAGVPGTRGRTLRVLPRHGVWPPITALGAPLPVP